MSTKSWKSGFYCLLYCLVIFLGRWTDATVESSLMGYASPPHTQEPVVFPYIIRVSEVKASHEGHEVISRQKRNIFYHSGLKLCGQETAEQVVANHLSYFHLRVCQETIWEAFKIFWDRLPEQEEYQSWMSQCQEGTVMARDIGSHFSQSKEHQDLVKQRMSHAGLKSEPTRSWQHMCSTPVPAAPEPVEAPVLEEVGKGMEDLVSSKVEESPLFNDITVQPTTATVLEQVVELSILLTGEMFSNELNNPASLKYQTLSRHLAEKIEDALQGLPGFKSVSVIDFRVDAIIVDYAVTVEVNGAGVSSEQLNYLTLQSNLVENSYHETEEHSTVVYTTSEVKKLFTEAFHINDIETVSEIPAPVSTADRATVTAVDDLPEDTGMDVLLEPPETTTVAAAEVGVVVLEESEIVSPAVALTTSAPETGSIEDEDLLLEDTVQTPAAENILPEELPPEAPSPELPASTPLPDSPVETEASGSDSHDLQDIIEPPTKTTEDENVLFEETASEEVSISTEATSEDGEKGDVSAVEEEPTTITEEHLDEVVVNEVPEIPEELEISTISTETTEEEGLSDIVPLSEAVDVVIEGRETSLEAPVVEDEAQQAPDIATEDLTEDEILLVNKNDEEPPLTDSPELLQPTALSPVKESPFTFIFDFSPDSDGQTDTAITSVDEILTTHGDLDVAATGDQGYEVVSYGHGLTNHTEEGSTGFPFSVAFGTDQASVAMPVNPGRALMVFFSLRVTNMIFSEDLFNKSSAEYKALEQRFLELLVPYLQSNLSHFENLEILNFRNGSIVVNSRMKFGKPVARGVTTTVYLILEDFCNTAYQTMNLAIDKYSLDVESGDQADPCKFQACNEYAECKVNKWSGEAECVCNAGYFSVDGLPCQSICELRTDFCLNDGKCDVIPGQGAICRCRVGENWWYRGEHCEEYVSEPLVVGIAIASVAGFLLVASGVLFFLARTLRDQYDKDESEDPIRRAESLPSLERATKYNPMYESEATTGYSHYYRRYPEAPVYSSASAEASTDFSSEEIRHIYENSELTKEEIQDRIRIIELYAKDRQFADFVRQHQAVLDTRRESSSTYT